MDIAENILEVKERINRALIRSSRKDKVTLIAVSKTVPAERVLEAYNAGHRVFGENRVQEWQKKSELMPADCEWHIIGRLQTNKVKYLNKNVALIHSLDRFSLLEKLNAEGEKKQIVWNTLVQVNVAQDEAKAGLAVQEVEDFFATAKDYPFVQISGLMTIGRLDADPAETRVFFRKLREIKDELIQKRIVPGDKVFHLSMGMSQDYEIAIEEGATLVRIGSSIFGKRMN